MKVSSQSAFSFLIAASAAATVSSQTIADIATGENELSTLVELVEAAGLLSLIDGSSGNNVTVFAPLNSAFEALPEELLNNLQDPAWVSHLTATLGAHVLDSVVLSTDITEDTTVTTLLGQEIAVTADPVTVGGATVVTPDLPADNGVVHVIDGVIPPTWLSTTTTDALSAAGFTTLVSLLETAELDTTVNEGGPWTIFAPTNEAIAAIPEAVTSCLVENAEWLTNVLTYHVLNDMIPVTQFEEGSSATAQGEDVSVVVTPEGNTTTVTVNGVAFTMDAAEVLANTSIAHSIDAVLLPPTLADTILTCNGTFTKAPTMSPTTSPAPTVSMMPSASPVSAADTMAPVDSAAVSFRWSVGLASVVALISAFGAAV